MAILKEHEARTGHNVMHRRDPFHMHATQCTVCIYLSAEYDKLNKAEADYYNKAHAEQEMLKNTTV